MYDLSDSLLVCLKTSSVALVTGLQRT